MAPLCAVNSGIEDKMGWEQEMQCRYQYSTDGQSEMVWQPTSVWRPDPPKNDAASATAGTRTADPVDMTDILMFYTAVGITVAASSYVVTFRMTTSTKVPVYYQNIYFSHL